MKQPFTFNGKELPDYVRVTGIELPVSPDISAITRTVPRMFGEIDTGTQIKGGEFKFDFVLALTPDINIHEAIEQLKVFLKGDNYEESKLVFKEQPDSYYMARMVGSANMKDMFVYGEGSFTMYASKLIQYEDKEEDTLKGAVEYKGSLPSSPIISVSLNTGFKNVVLKNMQTDKDLTLVGEFPSATKFKIDMGRRIVYLNGQINNKIISMESDWIDLVPGKNTITVKSGATGAGGSSVIHISYRNKWG